MVLVDKTRKAFDSVFVTTHVVSSRLKLYTSRLFTAIDGGCPFIHKYIGRWLCVRSATLIAPPY